MEAPSAPSYPHSSDSCLAVTDDRVDHANNPLPRARLNRGAMASLANMESSLEQCIRMLLCDYLGINVPSRGQHAALAAILWFGDIGIVQVQPSRNEESFPVKIHG